MNKGGIIFILGILLFFIIGGMLFLSSKKEGEQNILTNRVHPDDSGGIANRDFVPIGHSYMNGTHTFSGKIMLPTPCHQLFSDVQIAESFPEQVVINFTITNKTEKCAQVITPEPFNVSFQASESAVVRMTLNGKEMAYRNVPQKGTLSFQTEIKDSAASSTLKSHIGTTTLEKIQ